MIAFQVHQSDAIAELNLPELAKLIDAIATDFDVSGKISIAILSDREIRELNNRYLGHDYETDCISFDLSDKDDELEGEVLISADTARRVAKEVGWKPEHEAYLYLIHGILHILGFDDHSEDDKAQMRNRERHYLRLLGIPGWEHHPTHGDASIEQ